VSDVAREEIRIDQQEDGNAKVSLVMDGVAASWTYIVPMTIRIGEATVRLDGIGGVETVEGERNRGYSRRVLDAALAYMVAGDASLTALYGIPDYYPRWGYATIGPEGGIRLSRLDRDAQMLPGYTMRAARVNDVPRMRTLYDGATRSAVGALVRAESNRAWRSLIDSIEKREDECRVIVDDTEEVLAYAWRASGCWWMKNQIRDQPAGLHIGEAFAMTPRASDALLATARQWATELGLEHVDFHQPPLGPVGMSARLQDTANLSLSFRDAQFMGRSIGAGDLMRSIEAELLKRWQDSSFGWTGRLILRTNEDDIAIALTPTTLQVEAVAGDEDATLVDLTPGEIARLVFGSFPTIDFLDRVGVARDISDVLTVLFPKRTPYIYPADRF
jgi:hypothetical protein